MSVNIKPLEDRIVVQALEAEQTTASGLVIPDTAKEKPQEGEVVAIGPGRIDDNGNRVPLDVAVGDKVIYSKYGGTEVKYAGQEYLILSRPRHPRRRFLILPRPGRHDGRVARAPTVRMTSGRTPFITSVGAQQCPRSWSSTRTPAAPSSAASTPSPTPSR